MGTGQRPITVRIGIEMAQWGWAVMLYFLGLKFLDVVLEVVRMITGS